MPPADVYAKDEYVGPSKLAELLRRYKAGTASEEEVRLVEQWYESFGERMPEWSTRERERLQDTMLNRIRSRLSYTRRPGYRRLWPLVTAVAASLLVVFGTWYLGRFPYTPEPEPEWVEVDAGRGRLKKVQLPDSSMVWLNTGSRIGFNMPFGSDGQVREVVLLEGEAYFDVTADSRRPFQVRADSVVTQVLGTTFTVRAYHELADIRVSVTTGKVSVGGSGGRVLGVLGPGEEVVYNKREQLATVHQVDVHRRNAWMEGITHLSEVPFAELSLAFRQTYGLELSAATARIADQRYSIQLDRRTRYDHALNALCLIHGNAYRKEGGAVVVY